MHTYPPHRLRRLLNRLLNKRVAARQSVFVFAVESKPDVPIRQAANRSCSFACSCSCSHDRFLQTYHHDAPKQHALGSISATSIHRRARLRLSLHDNTTPASTLAARRHYDFLGHASHDTFPAKGHNSSHAKALGTASAEIHCLAYLARLFRPP